MSNDLKTSIQEILKEFETQGLKQTATALLNTLGYTSHKTIELDGTPSAFLEQFNQHQETTKFHEEKALVSDWQEIHLLFQLTDEEISSQGSLFQDTKVRQGLMRSYLFFAVKLSGQSYPRGKLADITRHINRLFSMPVMVLFEYEKSVTQASSLKKVPQTPSLNNVEQASSLYNVTQASSLHNVGQASSLSADLINKQDACPTLSNKQDACPTLSNKQDACATLSIAVINRRQHKRDADKDILGKVTLIQDINLTNPHRGHLDIIQSFSIPALQALDKRNPIDNFDALHEAWEQVFNVELLNERFYRELSNWYFWAMEQVRFPYDQLDPDKDKEDLFKDNAKVREHDAKNLIRLLTRLLFVWFVKEKGLIPDELFEKAELRKILNKFDPGSKETNYYKAILQNLFFSTLNQTHGKREFRNPGQNQNTTTLLRYESCFRNPQEFIELLEAHVPFMNGGLFECLDKPHPTLKGRQGGAKILYEDGFSDRIDNILKVPDYLFFSEEQTIDLSDIYGDTKRKNERVRGIIPLLNSYKFTIMENTPVEQEIALDPELLGKVFENLLASYNPETKTTARKQTGSFYTPRAIVDYMVDESLKAYLKENVEQASSLYNVEQASSLYNVEQASSLSAAIINKQDACSTLSNKQDACPTFFNPYSEVDIANRKLPHWHQDGVMYFITFRLADSLPKSKLDQLERERKAWDASHREPLNNDEKIEYYRLFNDRVEEWLDAGAGSCCLKRTDIAKVVGDALRHFDGDRYCLDHWVVMPNHVHVLLVPLGGNKLSEILHSWKSFTATKINKLLGVTGQQLWQHESYDHIVRSEQQLLHFRQYVDENPQKANVEVTQASRVTQASSLNSVEQASSLSADIINKQHACPTLSNKQDACPTLSNKQDACSTLSNTQDTCTTSTLAQRIDQLFQYYDEAPAFSLDERNALIEAIDKCKILDPACGSGAFPMGILHKLEFILGKLDRNNELWRDRQIAKVNDTIAAAEQIDDTSIRDSSIKDLEALKQDIQESFANNELGYGRKLYLIENCIYGVDIQSIATQVSKLRFFISLIVDQRVNAAKENFGIRPLPNLEIKFATANTLIQIEKPEVQGLLFENPNIKKLEDELKKVRHNLFNAKTPPTKRKYRERDKELRDEIAAELGADGWGDASARQLASWDPYDQNASSSFFDIEWMFDIKGFDIVIGNPPYVQIQKFPKEQKDLWEAQKFDTYSATADIYCLFYERGAELLKDGGYLCYITSNKWMRAGYGDKLREFLSSKVDTEMVYDFGMAQNFGAATTYTNILGLSKQSSRQCCRCCYAIDVKEAMAEPKAYFESNSVKRKDLSEKAWVIVSAARQRIKNEVEEQGIPLEDWDINIYRGVLTGFNDAFYLTQEQRDELVSKEPRAKELLVPLLRGRFVERYTTNWDKSWMIATFPSSEIKIDDYPAIKMWLSKFRSQLEPKPKDHSGKWDGRKFGSYDWFEIQDSIAYKAEFSKPKIIYPNMTKYLPFYYDREGQFFVNDKAFIITSEKESLPYLTAVLNSIMFRCCFRDSFPELLGNTYEVRKVFLEKIPIKKPTDFEAELFEKLVAMIQAAKRQSLGVAAMFLESLIDACVMELYFPQEAEAKNLQFMQQVLEVLKVAQASSLHKVNQASSLNNVAQASSLLNVTQASSLNNVTQASSLSADIINKQDACSTLSSKQDAYSTLQCVEDFVAIANNPKHPIRNQLMRLTIDSPDLFAVIKEEGRV